MTQGWCSCIHAAVYVTGYANVVSAKSKEVQQKGCHSQVVSLAKSNIIMRETAVGVWCGLVVEIHFESFRHGTNQRGCYWSGTV